VRTPQVGCDSATSPADAPHDADINCCIKKLTDAVIKLDRYLVCLPPMCFPRYSLYFDPPSESQCVTNLPLLLG